MTQSERLTTRINVRKWLIKMIIIAVACFAFSIWALLDAVWIYPERGRGHAEFALLAYLKQLDSSGTLLSDRVDDPATALRELSTRESVLGPIEKTRLEWLRAVSRIQSIDRFTAETQAEFQKRREPGHVPRDAGAAFADPSATLKKLDAELASRKPPVPLSGFDIPSQWAILAVAGGCGLYMTWIVLAASRRKFHYVPSEHRLILPDGREIVPTDIKEVDKRKWHKFFSSFILNDGTVVELDLLRYIPLEEWFLEIEKRTPNYVPPPPDESPGAAAEGAIAVGDDSSAQTASPAGEPGAKP